MDYKALYPEGRTFYCEEDEEARVIAWLKEMRERGLEVTLTVDVPAERLDEWYAAGLDLAYRTGT